MIKSNKDDALYPLAIAKEQDVKCQAFQKKAAVDSGYGDYKEQLANPKAFFVPTPAASR